MRYLDGVLTDGGICVHESMYHLWEDLIIHCSNLQMFDEKLALQMKTNFQFI